MTKRKKGHSNSTDELWSRKFDDDEGYTKGNYSRIERKKADKAISPVLKSLWIFLALFIILPTGVYLWYSYNEQHNVEPPQTEQVVVNQNESKESQEEPKSESESSKESQETESSEESAEESAVSQENESADETEVAVAEEEPVETQEPESETVPESSVSEEPQPSESEATEQSNTYTVKPGDNLYRIALNHGMTTDELKALNGISTDTVSTGSVLVVK